jgi:hypothetical protein
MFPLIRRALVAAALTATLVPLASAADLRPVLALTPTAAGPVKLGTPTRIGEPKLRRAIGNPTKVVIGGCEFANEHARNLSWGSAITVVFSDINGRGQQLHGWNVRKGTATVKVSLPYGVLIGTTAAAARKAIPAAKGKWNATFQTYELTTTKAPGMYWFSDRKDGNGPVTAISLNPVFCD